jgi:N-acetylglucosaminyl-diphospho-decaprenol L-rhamnosyltransferase
MDKAELQILFSHKRPPMSLLISIISHKQANMVLTLLKDIQQFCLHRNPEVVVTINTEEPIPFVEQDFDFKIRMIRNKYPKGFGANHNAAFQLSPSRFFCILNPDVRLIQDPFLLLSHLTDDGRIGVVSPLIVNRDHKVEDSARKLPTPFRLIKRMVTQKKEGKLDYNIRKTTYPDWVAGIFMIFSSSVFAALNGFDERFFLYFEDVDLCSRLRLKDYHIVFDPSVTLIHEARRESHRKLQYLLWHMVSGIRFFSSSIFWDILLKRHDPPGA